MGLQGYNAAKFIRRPHLRAKAKGLVEEKEETEETEEGPRGA